MGDYPTPFKRHDDEDDVYDYDEDEDEDEEDGIPEISIGICAMSKKVILDLPPPNVLG